MAKFRIRKETDADKNSFFYIEKRSLLFSWVQLSGRFQSATSAYSKIKELDKTTTYLSYP